MNVLFVAAEGWPFIKTGGLGDISYSLPKALKKSGVDARVVLPKYSAIPEEYKKKMKHIGHKWINFAGKQVYLGVETLTLDGVTYYFIDNEDYFKREKIYGEYDDCERFGFFSKAALESIDITEFYPDIVHTNDWHTGPVSAYLNKGIKNVYTIHNLRFQGIFPGDNLGNVLGLNPYEYFHEAGMKYYDAISFMKAGVNYADAVTTVSNTYAKEIKTQEYGEGLEGLFRHIDYKLYGIINGIDYKVFESKGRKTEAKKNLQKKMGLEVKASTPLIGMVTRFDRQKGLDLITRVFDHIVAMGAQLVILGSGEKSYEKFFLDKAAQYKGQVAVVTGFNGGLANEIYAGCDMFLMPSQFEPCGLSQMISMRQGTIPIVRETGGLADTVEPYNEYEDKGTGFSFRNYSSHELLNTVGYAIDTYKNKAKWRGLVKRAKEKDFSWDEACKKYIKLYEMLLIDKDLRA
jgi:starch synthase